MYLYASLMDKRKKKSVALETHFVDNAHRAKAVTYMTILLRKVGI